MSYTIAINEQQRAIIEAALRAAAPVGVPQYNGSDADETRVLLSLFADLPAEAANCPADTIHGFAL